MILRFWRSTPENSKERCEYRTLCFGIVPDALAQSVNQLLTLGLNV